jgi:hypothetical protein
MKRNLKLYFLAAIAVVGFGFGIARAQEQLPATSPIEKEIASRASDVSEVTLDKSMLGFAGQFIEKNDDKSVKTLVEGLDGIYIRNYEFAKEGLFTKEEIDQLRSYFTNGGEWKSLVKERSKEDGESSDIMVKMVNGQNRGMFILTSEPKEISIVFILGPIQMDQLKNLNGLGAQLGSMPDTAEMAHLQAEMNANSAQLKAAAKSQKEAEKAKKDLEKQKKEEEKNRKAVERGNQQEEK